MIYEISNNCSAINARRRILIASICIFLFLIVVSYCSYTFPETTRTIPKYSSNESLSSLKINKTLMSMYSITETTPVQIQEANFNVSDKGYLDKNFSKDCSTPRYRGELFKLMKFWIDFSAKHNIPWWLSYGSLVGAVRHKDMVPWDQDMDIQIPQQFESVIRKLSTPRKNISKKQPNIITRSASHCPYNGPRTDCQGNSVTAHVDGCAFCGPLARIFFQDQIRIDIYLVDFEIHNNRLEIMDEGNFEYSQIPPYHPYDWYFPLRNCSFMGFNVQCPRKSEILLKEIYKKFEPLYKCVKGTWI